MKGKLIVLSGPSGAGKGTICNYLVSQRNDVKFSPSYTSRSKRERDNVDPNGKIYFFVSPEEFEEMISNDGLIEWMKTLNGLYYGTPKQEIEALLEKGFNVIFEIEVSGAIKVKEKYPEITLVYISAPNLEVLEQRLLTRNQETPEELKDRLDYAKFEMAQIHLFDYHIVNHDCKVAAQELSDIIDR